LNETENLTLVANELTHLQRLNIIDGLVNDNELELVAKNPSIVYFTLASYDDFQVETYLMEMFLKDMGPRLRNVQYKYLMYRNEEGEEEGGDEEEKEDQLVNIGEVVNEKFPSCEIIENIPFDEYQGNIDELFNTIPNLQKITVHVSNEDVVSTILHSAQKNSEDRRTAANKLSQKLAGINQGNTVDTRR